MQAVQGPACNWLVDNQFKYLRHTQSAELFFQLDYRRVRDKYSITLNRFSAKKKSQKTGSEKLKTDLPKITFCPTLASSLVIVGILLLQHTHTLIRPKETLLFYAKVTFYPTCFGLNLFHECSP